MENICIPFAFINGRTLQSSDVFFLFIELLVNLRFPQIQNIFRPSFNCILTPYHYELYAKRRKQLNNFLFE
jgi:hypothetical protein